MAARDHDLPYFRRGDHPPHLFSGDARTEHLLRGTKRLKEGCPSPLGGPKGPASGPKGLQQAQSTRTRPKATRTSVAKLLYLKLLTTQTVNPKTNHAKFQCVDKQKGRA